LVPYSSNLWIKIIFVIAPSRPESSTSMNRNYLVRDL
jgi:hypothetical protein